MTISRGVGGQQQGGGGSGGGQIEMSADNQNTASTDINLDTQPGFSESMEDEMGEPPFPHAKLAMLEDKVSSPRWVVPVLPEQELECLLLASIDLCQKGIDVRSEACQRFFREGLTISFTKILTDEAVNSWKYNIHHCIQQNCERLVELCVLKLPHDWFPLLDLLAIVFNPNNKFHAFNGGRQSETVPSGSPMQDDELFARPLPDLRAPKGWLADLINKFGKLGGFQALLERFQTGQGLTVPVIHALLRPFGLCYEFLTVHTVTTYIMPIMEVVPALLDQLTDDELKKEAKNDAISAILKACKCLVSRVPRQEETLKDLEIFRLKMILRLLQISSFNGKMNALNEVNKVITSVSYYPHAHRGPDDEEWLTAERMAKWLKEHKVLQIVLRDSLHQPQYVEKLEKILRFVIKEKALTLEDLDNIWAAQAGKHEAIVKNLHDLLAKLAWDFSPEQLDHLFECFQSSWTNANKKQREKLLELIRRLAEDDKGGVMAHKVLMLFWNLAHSEDVPTEIMDQALNAHVKILDYSCSQERDAQKAVWLDKCVDELKSGKWVLPALKQIREICCLYEPPPAMNHGGHAQRTTGVGHNVSSHRQEVIEKLQDTHSLVVLVTNNLVDYMDFVRSLLVDNPKLDPVQYFPDGRYNHPQQIQERLNFLRFLLKDGQLWLCAEQAKQIWQTLAESAAFPSDREACFKWFSKLMGDEPDLDPSFNRQFFENNVLQLDPALLTESGMRCFERFFKAVNTREGKLKAKRRNFLMEDVDLIGTDYIWKVVTSSGEEIAHRAINLLKEVNTNLGPQLQANILAFHENFISECMDRLRAHFDTVSLLRRDMDSGSDGVPGSPASRRVEVLGEANKLCRVMNVLHEYMSECDCDFMGDRKILPLRRAYRGKHLALLVRFANPGRPLDDVEVSTHGNDTLGALRRQVLRRIKASPTSVKLDLFLNGELLDTADDRKLLSHIPLRDKTVLNGKLCQQSSNMPSSPDTSSDSSTSSPHHAEFRASSEAENTLPGVLMAIQSQFAQFFFQLADLGSALGHSSLRETARSILQLMPADTHTIQQLHLTFSVNSTGHTPTEVNGEVVSPTTEKSPPTMDSLFFSSSPSQALYYLQVMYSLMMPAQDPLSDRAFEFQVAVIRSEKAQILLDMMKDPNFLTNADLATKRQAYLQVLRIAKMILTIVGHVMAHVLDDNRISAQSLPSPTASDAPSIGNMTGTTMRSKMVAVLRAALQSVPHQSSEYTMRQVANKLAQALAQQMLQGTEVGNALWKLPQFSQGALWRLPDITTIKATMRLAWAASSGNLQLVHGSLDQLHAKQMEIASIPQQTDTQGVGYDDFMVCREALETLTVELMLHPHCIDVLIRDKNWHTFIIDLLLLSPSRAIRLAASEQFLLISTWCTGNQQPLQFCITLLFTVLNTTVLEHADQSHEYFQLLCRLLNFAFVSNCPLPTAETLLNNEIAWLKQVRENVKESGDTKYDDAVLEGHLGLARELFSFVKPDKKFELGCKSGNLIKEVVEDFVFPASHLMAQLWQTGDLPMETAVPVCQSPSTVTAAFELLVSLSVGCVPNMKLLVNMLTEMFYSEREEPLTEWDYMPPVGPRPTHGFVGLKNAGATCYMNSVLQQLYMVESIRVGLLAAEGAATDINEDFSGEDRIEGEGCLEAENDSDKGDLEESRKEYNVSILKQVQAIFGHLAYSKLQFYVPRGLWKHFKLQGEPVNLREQQDAVEFFMSLVESLDEAFKALRQEQVMSKVLGGSFSDQKICKGCPHRYSKEEPFSVISVDIRNHSNLVDSLEQYVKGELLEGADAYHCEKCNAKVVTVKRLCVKKLPPILAIQLKRFEYDYERVCAIKFNDYFEFPRDLDMEPYTVSGLAKLEGEVIECDYPPGDSSQPREMCTKYQLSGIVVHSGQASGGHYYSYILHRQADGTAKWYKFDDGDVTECKMDDPEEMKSQCFGGEYMGEVFDHMLKRMSYRRQKRWWNAYMLFYTRQDVEVDNLTRSINELSLYTKMGMLKMPQAIERSVRRQNIQFMHNRNQFCTEYFQFMRKLITCNSPPPNLNEQMSPENEDLSLLSVQLAARFLFHTGFHTKKTLRGPAMDWYDAIWAHLRYSKKVRHWFAHNVLFNHPHRFSEYLLSCPSPEVRSAFIKIIVVLAHCSNQDGPCPSPLITSATTAGLVDPNASLSDHLLHAVLLLLHREVADHGRQLPHYFSLFHNYAMQGLVERSQLLKLNVPYLFMCVAVDEGPGPAIKYQYPELTKLHQVVSLLIRCCDVSLKCSSSQQNMPVLPNPYYEPQCPDYLMPIQSQVSELLYGRTSYVKKLIEDNTPSEDTVKLLQFCSWENPHFSRIVLTELLWQVAFAYCHELRHHMELLLAVLLIEDSWQSHRIHNALKGVPEEREGLFETITRSKGNYQKRAYQCIKLLVSLFYKCRNASALLTTNPDIKRRWVQAVDWLQDELERRPYPTNSQYSYNWSPPAQSNDTTNGYFLERSNSARKTLEKALELCPEMTNQEQESEVMSEEGESSPPVADEAPATQSAVVHPARNIMAIPGNIPGAPPLVLGMQAFTPNKLDSCKWSVNKTPTAFCLADVEVNEVSTIRKKAKAKNEQGEEIETNTSNTTNTPQQSPVMAREVEVPLETTTLLPSPTTNLQQVVEISPPSLPAVDTVVAPQSPTIEITLSEPEAMPPPG
ncbi:probable ubiquitin carboxyl-terminal hydrolase FAF-X isoform X3 [Neocloeon triangulifer]|uniref:probable ubiquitin carboxyl-terminal hydrolase FAF-X isoform X3 n=1 Tax=Neocloeon triangulifer TaxID=2078957 RepID=UPI00286F4FF0|nr:probable ubiquitin carboxyl-terminal hydrolase FAF-X isoform X3 [Neocloeon triangulifer]